MTTPHTIRIQDFSNISREATGLGTISPGMLLSINSSGEFIPHAVAGGSQRKLFAIENDLLGKDISDTYASGEHVLAHVFRTGDRVYGVLPVGQKIAIGDPLESAGNGKLRKHELSSGEIPYPNVIVGYATEAVDLTVSGAVEQHIILEIV